MVYPLLRIQAFIYQTRHLMLYAMIERLNIILIRECVLIVSIYTYIRVLIVRLQHQPSLNKQQKICKLFEPGRYAGCHESEAIAGII